MAASVSWDGLRELAAFRAQNGCAISLYLDLDPSVSPTAGDAQARGNALVDEGMRRAADSQRNLSHEQRQALRRDLDRVRRFLEQEFSREGAHGLAVFAAGLDNVWKTVPLISAVPDAIKIGREFYLAPLVPLVGRGDGALVAVVGREQGHLYRLQAGRLRELADRTEQQAWQCPQCGRASVDGGSCPLDGVRMERDANGLDLAVHQTLRHGGTVWALRHQPDLGPVDGIGALL